MNIKSLIKNTTSSIILFSPSVLFLLDRFYYHKNWLSIEEVKELSLISAILIFFIRFAPYLSEITFGKLKMVRAIVEETTVKWLCFKRYEDMIEEIGVKLEKISGAQISGDDYRQLHKISEISLDDKLSEKEKNKLRDLWNKYVLRQQAYQCLAFFDKAGDQRRKIRSSFCYPSPQEVRKFSENAKFKEDMQKAGNEEAIKQFEALFKHFESSYKRNQDGVWLKWDLPEIILSFQKKPI